MKNCGSRIADGGLTEPRVARCSRGLFHSALRTPHSAFTLVEVLVALTIFALSAIILGSSYVNVLNSYAVAKRTAQSSEDVVFARSLIT